MSELEVRASPLATSRALERWLGGLSPHTARGYNHDVSRWLAWCAENGVDAGQPNGPDLVEHLASLSCGDAAKARSYSAIRTFYRWAKAEGFTDRDPPRPASDSQIPKVKGDDSERRVGLSEDEAQRLMAAALADTPRSAALVSLMLTTGLRISEALSVDQLTHRPGRTTVTVLGKGRKTRTVVVPPLAVDLCEKIAGVPLFRTSSGRRLSPREAHKIVGRLGRQAGLQHVHPHLLRHTSATLSILGGIDITAVAQMLGHANLNTVQIYLAALRSLEHSPAYLLASKIAPREEDPRADS